MKIPLKILVQYVSFAFLFTIASTFIGITAQHYASVYLTEPVSTDLEESQPPDIVLDPGHGGEDGGASAMNAAGIEVLEKQLNLAISENLCDLYAIFGYDVLMTRTEDTLLYDAFDDLEDYSGRKKTYDLRNRLRIAEESEAALFVGIHMNKFTQAKYKGLQVYYSPNADESRDAAAMIQSYTKKFIAPDNEREIKQATQAIYILKRITRPAVLVECGFLSNPEELAALETQEYRLRLAAAIFSATTEYLSAN